jgi:TRAP-type C4-dicarboxylate transport system permease large subunit
MSTRDHPRNGFPLYRYHSFQPLGSIYRGVVPFVLINFATLMLISYVPAISLVLVGSGR